MIDPLQLKLIKNYILDTKNTIQDDINCDYQFIVCNNYDTFISYELSIEQCQNVIDLCLIDLKLIHMILQPFFNDDINDIITNNKNSGLMFLGKWKEFN